MGEERREEKDSRYNMDWPYKEWPLQFHIRTLRKGNYLLCMTPGRNMEESGFGEIFKF